MSNSKLSANETGDYTPPPPPLPPPLPPPPNTQYIIINMRTSGYQRAIFVSRRGRDAPVVASVSTDATLESAGA